MGRLRLIAALAALASATVLAAPHRAGADPGNGIGQGIGGGRGHKSAPAPLLAAGIPAFLAIGGAAAIRRLVRGRRPRPPGA